MSNENEIKEVLKKMAQLSITTNQINGVQQANLKAFPLVFFNGVKSAKVEYDLTNNSGINYDTDPKTLDITYNFGKPETRNFKIKYSLEMESDAEELNFLLDKRFEALENAISTLLWKGIPISVDFNGKNIYKSK